RHVGLGRFQYLLEGPKVALLRLDLVGKVDEAHPGLRSREIDAELLRHLDEPGLRRDRIEKPTLLFARRLFRIRHLNANRPENAQVAWLAPECGQLAVDRGAMLLHAGY